MRVDADVKFSDFLSADELVYMWYCWVARQIRYFAHHL